tara:strand:+ start:399 stop:611 length:213 start_codon:yes stop_codon:yes gene_type:complete
METIISSSEEWATLEKYPGKLMRYDDAIDLAFTLSNSDDDNWTYTVEINPTSGMARIAIFDETKTKLGYL